MGWGAILTRRLEICKCKSTAALLMSKTLASSTNTTASTPQQASPSNLVRRLWTPVLASVPHTFNTRFKNDDKLIQSKMGVTISALPELNLFPKSHHKAMLPEMGVTISVFPELNVFQNSHSKTMIYPKGFLRPILSALVGVSSSPIRVQRRGFADVPLQGIRTKDLGALTFKLAELKNLPRPYQNFMFPSAYVSRGGIPMYQTVSRDFPTHLGPMVYDLRIDVWPEPFCWMLHGIWPAFICGHWLVHYKIEGLDISEMYLMKEQVKQEIQKLDYQTKETLHEIWQSYGDDYEDLREQDMEFWAYQKVVHCWDVLNCPKGHYFHMTAKLGKYARELLLNWTKKSNYTPNKFYTSESIRNQMKLLFGVSVYLIVKADDDMGYDPESTEIPFLHSLGFMVAQDPTQLFQFKFYDHPSGLTKVPKGYLFMLM